MRNTMLSMQLNAISITKATEAIAVYPVQLQCLLYFNSAQFVCKGELLDFMTDTTYVLRHLKLMKEPSGTAGQCSSFWSASGPLGCNV